MRTPLFTKIIPNCKKSRKCFFCALNESRSHLHIVQGKGYHILPYVISNDPLWTEGIYVLTIRRAEKHLSLEALVAGATRITIKSFTTSKSNCWFAFTKFATSIKPGGCCSRNEISRARAVIVEAALRSCSSRPYDNS